MASSSSCQGRCSARLFSALLSASLAFAFFSTPSFGATTWDVGDSSQWTTGFDYSTWTAGKTFRVGDTLYFAYSQGAHDVAQVSQADYSSCTATNAIATYTAGDTSILLNSTGNFYYICTIPGHCSQQMKLAVTVTTASNSSSSSNSTTSSPSNTNTTSSPSAAPSDLRSALPLQLGSLAIFVSALLGGFVL